MSYCGSITVFRKSLTMETRRNSLEARLPKHGGFSISLTADIWLDSLFPTWLDSSIPDSRDTRLDSLYPMLRKHGGFFQPRLTDTLLGALYPSLKKYSVIISILNAETWMDL